MGAPEGRADVTLEPLGSSKEEAGVDGWVNKRLNGSGNACFVLVGRRSEKA